MNRFASILPFLVIASMLAPLAAGDEPLDGFHLAGFTIPWNLTGHPAAVVCAGFVGGGGPGDGPKSPCGVQLVARRHDDAALMAAAQELEGALAGALAGDLDGEDRWHTETPSKL